jgi:hypothetical protein
LVYFQGFAILFYWHPLWSSISLHGLLYLCRRLWHSGYYSLVHFRTWTGQVLYHTFEPALGQLGYSIVDLVTSFPYLLIRSPVFTNTPLLFPLSSRRGDPGPRLRSGDAVPCSRCGDARSLRAGITTCPRRCFCGCQWLTCLSVSQVSHRVWFAVPCLVEHAHEKHLVVEHSLAVHRNPTHPSSSIAAAPQEAAVLVWVDDHIRSVIGISLSNTFFDLINMS